MTSLWLVRHGQTDWNSAGRWQGQSPYAPGLNAVGRAQALALRDQLKNVHVSAIYASDLLRARQTAELIANPLGLSVKLEPRLREMKLGKWEGLLSKEIEAQFTQVLAERELDPINTCAPGGESPRQVAKRVAAAMDEIGTKHSDGPVLIVAHGISIAIITCLALGIPPARLYEYVPDNANLRHVQWNTWGLVHERRQWRQARSFSLPVQADR